MERDYPIGHPAASDYAGQPYHPNRAPFEEDHPKGHPARNGKNVSDLDRPDGHRAAFNRQRQDLQVLAAMGSLPPIKDDQTDREIELTPQELAFVYAVRQGLPVDKAQEVTEKYNLTPLAPVADIADQNVFSAEEQAVMILQKRGYSPERAKAIIDKYGVPDVLLTHEQDAHR